jgi:hypothetical protein
MEDKEEADKIFEELKVDRKARSEKVGYKIVVD